MANPSRLFCCPEALRHIPNGCFQAGIRLDLNVAALCPRTVACNNAPGDRDFAVTMARQIASDEIDADRAAAHSLKTLRTYFHVPKRPCGVSKGHKPPVAVDGDTETDVFRAVLLGPIALAQVLLAHEDDAGFHAGVRGSRRAAEGLRRGNGRTRGTCDRDRRRTGCRSNGNRLCGTRH